MTYRNFGIHARPEASFARRRTTPGEMVYTPPPLHSWSRDIWAGFKAFLALAALVTSIVFMFQVIL